jgi:hypothetical protein
MITMSKKQWFFLALGIAAVNYTVGATVWYRVGKGVGYAEGVVDGMIDASNHILDGASPFARR